jgi:RNA polymerase sigma-70 factor, ECF subfamily
MDAQKVWEEYGVQLRNFLVSRVSAPEDADDLLQEILFKTHKNLSSLKKPAKFKSWLYQIARNILIDYYRKQRPNVSDQTIPELEAIPEENLDPANPVYSDMVKCLEPFLMQLPEKYRQAIEATDLRGTSQKDLAEELGLGHSTVKSRVQRGRAMLRDLFHECCIYKLDSRGRIMDYKGGSGCC